MGLVEKVSQEDLILYEIIRNPALFSEFILNQDLTVRDERIRLTSYQKEMVCDFNSYVSICCGRAVGKTFSLSALILWIMIYKVFPSDYVVYHIPSRSTLDPVWTNLVKLLRSNSFLKNFIHPSSGVNASEYKITLINNSVLMCRIAGQTGTGAAVIGLHTPFEIVDESGYYPYGTWLELQPTLNTFTPGFRLMVSGVPDGRREKSVCYSCDQENSEYTKHRVSALDNPRFSEKDHINAISQYGGKDSEDYTHMVLGHHGKPVFALFDRTLFEIEQYPVYKLFLNGTEIHENIIDYITRLAMLPAIPDKSNKCIMGIDLGYTEPTAILIMYLDRYGRLKFNARVQLTKVSYTIQEKIIDYLDSKYEPVLLGMDEGNAGKSTRQHLVEDREYLHKNYKKRLVPVDFSSSIIIGIDSLGEEIKNKTKPFATSILQDYSNNHKIIYSSTDLEMVAELERMTYTKTPTGEIVYRTLTPRGGKRGDDHFTSALLCATLGYYLNNEFILNKADRRKLIGFSWLGT